MVTITTTSSSVASTKASKTVAIPSSQKTANFHTTEFNSHFAHKAEALRPTLHRWPVTPRQVVGFVPDDASFFGITPVHRCSIEALKSMTWGRGEEFILDLGSHYVGFLNFHLGADGLNIDAPTRLRITFGEVPYDVTEELHPCNTWISTSWLPDEVINIDWVPEEVKIPRRHACRFIRIQVIDTSLKFRVKFSDITFEAVSSVSPTQIVPTFPFDNERLHAIDRVSRDTLQSCMQTIFEDGPRRDRRLWSGDLRLQALTNYCTFQNYDLVKRCLYLFAAVPRDDGSLPACLFEKPTLTAAGDYIVDYDVLYGSMVYDYAMASGDVESARELWPTVLSSAKTAVSHVGEDGAFSCEASDLWKFVDWARNLDTNAAMHGLVLYSLKNINRLAELLAQPLPFESLVSRMTAATQEHFYDAGKGVFISGKCRQISWASQAWIALSGSVDAKICKRALMTAMADADAVKPLTPYLYHHVAEALATVGAEEESLDLIEEYWGGMIDAGADTFWECFDPRDSRSSPYGDCHNNSYCHAWSCTPSYLLRVTLKDWIRQNRPR